MKDPNDIPRGVKLLQAFWPLVLAFLVSGATMVQATSKVSALDDQVQDIRANGAPVVRERLARMEAAQAAQSKQLDRMESTLADIDRRTRERNLDGL